MGGISKSKQPAAPVVAPDPAPAPQRPSSNADEKAPRTQTRGRAATIRTSDRDLIHVKPQFQRKTSLLGE